MCHGPVLYFVLIQLLFYLALTMCMYVCRYVYRINWWLTISYSRDPGSCFKLL